MKKIALVFIIVCAGALVCASQLYGMEPDYMKSGYMENLPEDVQILIIQDLISGNNLRAITRGINAANKTTLSTTINKIYGNQKVFTQLVHMLADKFNTFPYVIAKEFKTPTAEKYIKLGDQLLQSIKNYKKNPAEAYSNVIEILEQGADVNCSDFIGMTPLNYAMRDHPYGEPSIELIKLLLDSGAIPTEHNLEMAIENENNFPKTIEHPLFIKQLIDEAKVIRQMIENAMKKYPPSH